MSTLRLTPHAKLTNECRQLDTIPYHLSLPLPPLSLPSSLSLSLPLSLFSPPSSRFSPSVSRFGVLVDVEERYFGRLVQAFAGGRLINVSRHINPHLLIAELHHGIDTHPPQVDGREKAELPIAPSSHPKGGDGLQVRGVGPSPPGELAQGRLGVIVAGIKGRQRRRAPPSSPFPSSPSPASVPSPFASPFPSPSVALAEIREENWRGLGGGFDLGGLESELLGGAVRVQI